MASTLPSIVAITMLCIGCSTSSEVGSFDRGQDAGPETMTPLDLAPSTAHLALGGEATCAIDSGGGVSCWGSNVAGQLGVGDINLNGSSQPLAVPGLKSGVRAVFGGPVSQCAVLEDGHATCWGDSIFGSFNHLPGTHYPTPSPFEAPGLGSVASMRLGIYFHCALLTDGSVKCYGINSAGQLGNGTLSDSYIPTGVVDLPPSRALAANGFFACAAAAQGAVKCWGNNEHGQLGDGSTLDHATPVDVQGLTPGATAVCSGREHACALLNGSVWCWGGNGWGQVGIGAGADVLTPAPVPALPVIEEIACGLTHTCARSGDGAVYCWGAPDSGSASSPAVVVPADAVEIGAGGRHSCALLSNGWLRCWGSNDYGQLGPFGGNGQPL